ncbi:MAG: pilus assembly protein PilM [Oscillospiraceae bacterium]|jgi:type IV pilus assembly protein PilM|nr:pilus assembly protein PilM [Oscillospiraceae bacterium]
MAKTYVSFDIGSNSVKMAVCSGGRVLRLATGETPDNLIKEGRIVSPETMAEFIRETAKRNRINVSNCAVVIPPSLTYCKPVTIPAMSRENLHINLPYEFRDFITQEKDKYFYDYAVINTQLDENGAPAQFELVAAAVLKETIASYTAMFRRAGFRLKIAVPEEIAYMNILRKYRESAGEAVPGDIGFIELGHTATRMFIYHGLRPEATRVIEAGGINLDQAIADSAGVDEHIARAYKHANGHGELSSEVSVNIYQTISMDIVRAINFYGFNVPDSRLEDVFICGGGASVTELINRLREDLPLRIHHISEMFPKAAAKQADLAVCQTAIGAVLY